MSRIIAGKLIVGTKKLVNRLWFLIALLFLPITSILSQSLVHLQDKNEISHIGKNTSYFEDVTLHFSIEDILKNTTQTKFTPCLQDVPNFASTNSAYWLRFEVEKSKIGDFYLEVGTAFMDSISLYEFDEKGILISSRYAGDELIFEQREVKISNYLFSLDIPSGVSHTFYLRVKSSQPLFFPLRVGTLKDFMEYNHDKDFIQGIYFGFMFLIFLYNLFLYFMIKEKIYLYYIAYVLSMIWFMNSIFGYFFEYLWANAPWFNQMAVVSSGLTMVAATLFTQRFLETRKSNRLIHHGSNVFAAIGVIVCLLVVFDLKIAGLILAQVGLLLMAFYFLFLGIRFKIAGFEPAKYYLIAWGALIIGIIMAILESLNLVPVMLYVNAMQLGSGLEVLLLSFALGDRINTYKKQKENAQIEALRSALENEKLIREQNFILEQKVKERTEEIAEQNEELVSINEEKDTLISIVSHDLRSPLNNIKGFIQLIKLESSTLTKNHQEFLDGMHQSADRLTQMISRVLDINAIEAKNIRLKLEKIDLTEIAENVMKLFYAVAAEKNINIVLESNKGSHFANVDRNYLIQILENLISNAIKFSNTKTTITLRVITKNKLTLIEIEDQGPGISKEDQKKLFGKFQQLTAKPTAGETSTGIGLSIVKKYIEAMNGKISCESVLGKGTKFVVSFKEASK